VKRIVAALIITIALIGAGGPWACYWLGLQVVTGKPAHPQTIASQEKQAEVWLHAYGKGTPQVLAVTPYNYVQLSLEPGSYRPSLLVAWWVATEHYDANRHYKGNLWRQLSCGALSVWLTRSWSTEQLLSKVAEQRGKNAA